MKKALVHFPTPHGGVAQSDFPGEVALDIVDDHMPGPGRVFPRERISDVEILFCDYPPHNIDEMTSLRWIQIGSVGFNMLQGLGLAERGIQVTNARGVFDVPIAEWNIAMMIQLLRSGREMYRNQEEGKWDRSPRFQRELRGSTLGIWGYGGIARETARLAKAMGLKVFVMTRGGISSRDETFCVEGTGDRDGILPDRIFRSGEERDFLSGLDFLLLALPLSPATEGLIGERELGLLPSSAFVLNPARGPIIVEEALINALNENRIAGAALDTHYHYPMPPEHPLWRMQNVIMTPHISGSSGSPHFLARVWEIFAGNVSRYVNGGALLNEVAKTDLAELDGGK